MNQPHSKKDFFPKKILSCNKLVSEADLLNIFTPINATSQTVLRRLIAQPAQPMAGQAVNYELKILSCVVRGLRAKSDTLTRLNKF